MQTFQLNPHAAEWAPSQQISVAKKKPEAISFAAVLKKKQNKLESDSTDVAVAIPGWHVTNKWNTKTANSLLVETEIPVDVECPTIAPDPSPLDPMFKYRGDECARQSLHQLWMDIARQKKEILRKKEEENIISKAEKSRVKDTHTWHNVLASSAPDTSQLSYESYTLKPTSSVFSPSVADASIPTSNTVSRPTAPKTHQVVCSELDFWNIIMQGRYQKLGNMVDPTQTEMSFNWKNLRWKCKSQSAEREDKVYRVGSSSEEALNGLSPLHVAVEYRHNECVQVLLDAGRYIHTQPRIRITGMS
jgi:hypothetical protein